MLVLRYGCGIARLPERIPGRVTNSGGIGRQLLSKFIATAAVRTGPQERPKRLRRGFVRQLLRGRAGEPLRRAATIPLAAARRPRVRAAPRLDDFSVLSPEGTPTQTNY